MKINFQKSGGLVPVIIQHFETLQVLMLGYMNEEALEKTNNKVALAADKLKLRRTTLIEKMKKYSINLNQNIN